MSSAFDNQCILQLSSRVDFTPKCMRAYACMNLRVKTHNWHSKIYLSTEYTRISMRSLACMRVCICMYLLDLCVFVLNFEHRNWESSSLRTYMPSSEVVRYK